MTTVTRLRALRTAAQGIGARSTPTAVVDRMTALQAQDLGQSLWAVGIRAGGSSREDVRRAFDRGEVVRSWPMRGTLHVLRPDDLRVLLSLTAERTVRATVRRAAQLGLDDRVVGAARCATVEALEGGRALDRDGMMTAFRAAGIDTDGGRGFHLLFRLAQDGLVVWGPTSRVGQAVVLLDEWAPPTRPVPDRDEALGRVLVGYLRGRGPATEADAASWTKLPLRDLRTARAVAGDAVEDLGDGLLALADAAPGTLRTPSAHLLPGFDEYLLGYADRAAMLDPSHADRVVPGGNGIFLPTAVVRGRVVGTWRRAERSRDVRVTVTPFERLDPASVRALEAAAERYGRWVGTPVAFELAGPVA